VAVTTTSTTYYDSNYSPLGYRVSDGDYAVAAAPYVMPAEVIAGSNGAIGNFDVWTNHTQMTDAGKETDTHLASAENATTVLIDLIADVYNSSSTLIETDQITYQFVSEGAFTLFNINI
jgi:hypothetical protein